MRCAWKGKCTRHSRFEIRETNGAEHVWRTTLSCKKHLGRMIASIIGRGGSQCFEIENTEKP